MRRPSGDQRGCSSFQSPSRVSVVTLPLARSMRVDLHAAVGIAGRARRRIETRACPERPRGNGDTAVGPGCAPQPLRRRATAELRRRSVAHHQRDRRGLTGFGLRLRQRRRISRPSSAIEPIASARPFPFFVSEYSTRTGVSGTTTPLHQPFFLELLQALAQHAIGDVGNGVAQRREPAGLLQQQKDDRAGPAAADQLAGVVKPRAQRRRAGWRPVSWR